MEKTRPPSFPFFHSCLISSSMEDCIVATVILLSTRSQEVKFLSLRLCGYVCVRVCTCVATSQSTNASIGVGRQMRAGFCLQWEPLTTKYKQK